MTELYSAASSQGHDEAGGAVSPYIQATALIPCFQVQIAGTASAGGRRRRGVADSCTPGPLGSALQVAVGLGEGGVSAHGETTGPLSEARAANSRLTAKARRAAAGSAPQYPVQFPYSKLTDERGHPLARHKRESDGDAIVSSTRQVRLAGHERRRCHRLLPCSTRRASSHTQSETSAVVAVLEITRGCCGGEGALHEDALRFLLMSSFCH